MAIPCLSPNSCRIVRLSRFRALRLKVVSLRKKATPPRLLRALATFLAISQLSPDGQRFLVKSKGKHVVALIPLDSPPNRFRAMAMPVPVPQFPA